MTEKAKEMVRISIPTLIVLLSTLAVTVGAFTVVRGKADMNTNNQLRHEKSDEKRIDKIVVDVEKLEGRTASLEKSDIRRAAEYSALRDDNARQENTLIRIEKFITSYDYKENGNGLHK